MSVLCELKAINNMDLLCCFSPDHYAYRLASLSQFLGSRKTAIKAHIGEFVIFTSRCYAERGYATVSRLSVCVSVCPSVCDVKV